jgi:hypothetical protein
VSCKKLFDFATTVHCPTGHRHTRADQIQAGWSSAMSLYNLKLNHGADPAHHGAQLFASPR